MKIHCTGYIATFKNKNCGSGFMMKTREKNDVFFDLLSLIEINYGSPACQSIRIYRYITTVNIRHKKGFSK